MRHLTDGTLRRMVDEPLSVPAGERAHYERCLRCQGRRESIANDAAGAALLLSGPPLTVDSRAGLVRLQERMSAEGMVPRARTGRMARLPLGRMVKGPAAALTAAVALIGALTLTPAGSMAQSFISVFQPKQVVAIPVTAGELQTLPDLKKFGTVHVPTRVGDLKEANAAAASTASGMHVLQPGFLPGGIPAQVQYHVAPGTTGSFTFSAATARKAVAANGQRLPPMPAALDGSTLRVTSGAAVVAIRGGSGGSMPSLVVGQMKAPTVTSTRATVQQIEGYVLRLPGVSPQLAAAIRSIGDPVQTLPIPIPVDRAQAHSVQVAGVPGLAIGDSTGIGSAVIWEKDGIVYGVAGMLSADQALAIANSLH